MALKLSKSMEAGPPPGVAWFRPAAVALLAVALALRLTELNGSLWIDEAGSLARASAGDFWGAARADVHPPLYFLLLRLGLRLTHSFALLRLFSLVCGLALVALGIFFLRRTPFAAIALGAILAGLPECVRHSQELRPYSLLLLLLGLSMMISIRIAAGEGARATRICLCLALVAAAATHLVTAFFLLALAPLLAAPALESGARGVAVSLAPLIPAALLLWFESAFLRGPGAMPEGWWIPPSTIGQVAGSMSDATGWSEVRHLAGALSRRIPGGRALVEGAGAAAAAFVIWAAMGRRACGRIAWLLLASGAIYMGSLIAYSRMFEPLVIGRTLLPGLLPVAAGLAWGIGASPSGFRRVGAAAAISLFFLLASVPGVLRALRPPQGLRGLSAAARAEYRPGDQLVLFRSMDYGMLPYWPDLMVAHPLLIDQTKSMEQQLADLRGRLSLLSSSGRVILVSRDDYYMRAHRAEASAVMDVLSARGLTPHEIWHEGDMELQRADGRDSVGSHK